MRNITTFLKLFIQSCIIWLSLIPALKAQSLASFAGARAQGLAGASTTLVDAWSTQQNVAASAFLNQPLIGLSHQNRYFLSEFALSHGAFSLPTTLGTFSSTFQYFGFNLHNQTAIGLGFARKFGHRFSAGIKANYHLFYTAQASQQSRFLTFDFGLFSQVFERLKMGAHVRNLNGAAIGESLFEEIPAELRLGSAYNINADLDALLEVSKTIGKAEQYRFGLEYNLLSSLSLRTGVRVPDVVNSFGLGFNKKAFSADIAYSYANQIGSNANLSVQYAF